MEVLSGYIMTVSLLYNYFCAFTAFVLLLYIFSDSENPNAGFSDAGAGYTFYPLSINREGFFLSINREKIRLFPSAFMRTNF